MITHTYDQDLTEHDIQQLASRDAIAAFFGHLGYDTNHRLVQNISALGISSESLKTSITHVERIASQDAGLFEVYLFELRSLTVASTQSLVRNFRDRPGDYLLVLTDNYERLDFVLVERYSAGATQQPDTLSPAFPAPRIGVRPRILTVQRRQPDRVPLRVLRRFTYTESDCIAQFDKLLSAYDVAAWSEPFFNNRALFSDYYLKENLPTSPYWDNPQQASALVQSFKTLRILYDGVRDTFSNAPERDVQSNLIEPVLTSLGFTYQPTKQQHNTGDIEPDYRLYSTGNNSAGSNPSAVCLAYAWGRSLDGKDERRGDASRADENPGAAVVTLLDKGEAAYAIVTNGKIWRLYSAQAHSRATNYYEIDLEETLALDADNVQIAFRYFWLLFRAAAFVPFVPFVAQSEQGQQKDCFLDWLLSESESYALKLGERLKKRVFDEIFPHFAEGFIIHARATGQLPANLEDMEASERNQLLEPYFAGTLTFLYRLLFLLYAESRDLLPVREMHGYQPKSLAHLKERIASKVGNIEDSAPVNIRQSYSNSSTTFYDGLQELFHAVDKGNSDLNVPIYNGGLFVTQPNAHENAPEMQAARFLATHKIPDRTLALGLDRMTRDFDDKRLALAFIDYKSLGVRQLGSIYEGLLEFKLRVAPAQMAIVKDKKDVELIIPYSEAQAKQLPILKIGRGKDALDRIYPRGKVYLENDRRERKATGSYYTPDYIVKYIVANTVGPILTQKLEGLRPLFRDAELTLKNKREKAVALKKQHLLTKGDDPEQETYNHYRTTLNEQFFDLKVLDPAMGSGHFLVEAVDYITDQMVKFLTAFKWSPVLHELAQTRRAIQQEMEEQKVTVDVSKLTDINLLKRQVLKRCIYGVDLNPMAVELAKVSLWLDCFTLGAPLSFLDHHMKAGNSLIGGNVKDVQDALSNTLWSSQFSYLLNATELMRRVGSLSDITASQVAESRTAYRGAYDALAPFKRLLNVWVSEYFANKGAQNTTRHEAGAILDANDSVLNAQDKQLIATAAQLATTKRFFHWELEFPEVFYDSAQRKENGGFDAVVGNPPYVRQEGLGDDKSAFEAIYTVYKSIADLYTYFIERGNKLLCSGGRFGMITANKFMRANYGIALRSFLTTQIRLEKLIDFGDLPVFGDATTYPLIILSSHAQRNGSPIEYALIKTLNFDSLQAIMQIESRKMPESAFTGTNWSLAIGLEQAILDKLKANSVSLGEYVDNKILFGIKTGFNEAFIIDKVTRDKLIAEDAKSAEVIKPFLVGENVRKYAFEFQNKYLIWTYVGILIKNYPTIFKHLQQYQAQLEKRWDQGNYWWELRPCDYYSDFEKPKIIFPDIAVQPRFAFTRSQEFVEATAFIIPTEDLYLFSLLNSKIFLYFIQLSSSSIRGGFLRFKRQYVKPFPIRRINFTTPSDERTRLLEKASTLYATCIAKDDPACVLGFVEHHLSRQPEEADVVHDLLAFLAEEMIRLNKEKRAATRAFLDWLTLSLRILPDKDNRIGIDALTGKSKLLDFPGDYQKHEPALSCDQLLDILQKNRTRLGVRLTDTALTDKIKLRYEECLAQVLPLKAQLAKTDKLIDSVVYRLYGLTEEEIAVVEGRG